MLKIAAVIALMATPASADMTGPTGAPLETGSTTGNYTVVPTCVIGGGCFSATLAPAPKTKCPAGWMLVYAATQHNTVNKCAAVGDLRDPE